MKKTITTFMLVLVLCISCNFAFAMGAEESSIGVFRLDDISSISPSLSVSGTTATYQLTVRGSANVTKLSAVLQLQKKNSDGTFSNYGTSWTASSSSNYLYTYGTKTVESGGTYRLKVTVTPYTSAGAGTPVTAYS